MGWLQKRRCNSVDQNRDSGNSSAAWKRVRDASLCPPFPFVHGSGCGNFHRGIGIARGLLCFRFVVAGASGTAQTARHGRQMTAFSNVEKPAETKKAYPCPCCGVRTFYGRGHHGICAVCYWEDDGQDDHDADEVRGGPNNYELSLSQARRNFAKYQAVERKVVPFVRPPLEDERP